MGLRDHLTKELAETERFCALLEKEQKLYSGEGVSIDLLQEVVDEKQRCVEAIKTLEEQRQLGQQRLNYPPGMEGAVRLAKDMGVIDLWQKILETSYRAQQLNIINGNLIQMASRQNQAILDFLHKAAGGVTYAPDGSIHQGSLGGIKTKA